MKTIRPGVDLGIFKLDPKNVKIMFRGEPISGMSTPIDNLDAKEIDSWFGESDIGLPIKPIPWTDRPFVVGPIPMSMSAVEHIRSLRHDVERYGHIGDDGVMYWLKEMIDELPSFTWDFRLAA